MKFRPQRSSLKESMNAVVTLDPTIDALARHLNVDPEDVETVYYMYDTRLGWDTYAVLVDGDCVGFTDYPACPYFNHFTLSRTPSKPPGEMKP